MHNVWPFLNIMDERVNHKPFQISKVVSDNQFGDLGTMAHLFLSANIFYAYWDYQYNNIYFPKAITASIRNIPFHETLTT